MKSIFIFYLFFQSFFTSHLISDPYISLEYTGNIDKPIPEMIFFINHYDLNKSAFVDTFRVSNIEFDSLRNVIKTNHRLFEQTEINFYRVTIFNGTSKEYFFVRNKQGVAKVFNEIDYQLRFSKRNVQIRDKLKSILNRI